VSTSFAPAPQWQRMAQETFDAASAWRESGLLAARWPLAGFAPAEMAVGFCGAAFDTLDAWVRHALLLDNDPQAQKAADEAKAVWRVNALDLADGMEAGRFECDLGSLDYKLWAPAKARALIAAGKRPPLVVFLHGCKQTADSFAVGTRAREVAEEMGFIALCPQQSEKANGWRCWNWFRPDNQRHDSGESALIAALAQCAQTRFNADARRVYAMGLSAGGSMAATLATLHSDVFAGCAAHSGLPFGSARDLPSALATMRGAPVRPGEGPRVPLIVFQGTADETVACVNGERLLRRPKEDAEPPSVSHAEINGRGVEIRRFAATEQAPAAELWTIDGAGHAWSGGDPAGGYADAQGPDATRAAMRFFEGQRKKHRAKH
jgi:poly(hydroxyalkanoate) depolymerase family esterase